MFNLFELINSVINGFSGVILEILSVLSVLFGIYVINSKNPIVSVLFLIALFATISVNLIMLGVNFIGLSYLLVYVGAVSILFLFILMLINVRISELLNDTSKSIPLAIFTGLSIGFPLYIVLNVIDFIKNYLKVNLNLWIDYGIRNLNNRNSHDLFNDKGRGYKKSYEDINYFKEWITKSEPINYTSSNDWETTLVESTDIASVGNNLYSTYPIWLIISSLILLLAMIGAITITKKD